MHKFPHSIDGLGLNSQPPITAPLPVSFLFLCLLFLGCSSVECPVANGSSLSLFLQNAEKLYLGQLSEFTPLSSQCTTPHRSGEAPNCSQRRCESFSKKLTYSGWKHNSDYHTVRPSPGFGNDFQPLDSGYTLGKPGLETSVWYLIHAFKEIHTHTCINTHASEWRAAAPCAEDLLGSASSGVWPPQICKVGRTVWNHVICNPFSSGTKTLITCFSSFPRNSSVTPTGDITWKKKSYFLTIQRRTVLIIITSKYLVHCPIYVLNDLLAFFYFSLSFPTFLRGNWCCLCANLLLRKTPQDCAVSL